MTISKKRWGIHKGHEVYLIHLRNRHIEVTLSNFGCTVVSVMYPGKDGQISNLVLGYDSLDKYIADPYYMGCIIGRFANRIANASFTVGEKRYYLTQNEAGTGNHLHGGLHGFNKKVFTLQGIDNADDDCGVQFYYRSKDSEEGYPGNLNVTVTYTLTSDDELVIDYKATADKVTPVNLTNHSYFNLSGTAGTAIHHALWTNAQRALVAGSGYIPTGEIKPVKGTGLDFTKERSIGDALHRDQLPGYNEYLIFDGGKTGSRFQAALRDTATGIVMTVQTSLPGMMLYTGDYLDYPFKPRQGICLETQFYPDSPNHPHFPNVLLMPGEEYHHYTKYHFYTDASCFNTENKGQ